MKRFYILSAVVLTLAISASAQTTSVPQALPQTFFEAALLAPDAIIVRGSSSIGTLANDVAAPIEFRAEELSNLQTSKKVYGVVVQCRIQHHTEIDYIDYDELDPLIQAIHRMQQNDQSPSTHLDNLEVSFRTRGGLLITKFSAEGKMLASIKSPNSVAAEPNLMNVSALDALERVITAAKARLDAIK